MNWNRRNTSEISIHNYPEHLNPFYENDNHRRLRFWNFSKEGNNKRRSFSIGNLKNIWSSYSLSPKKSSTLGINKTSESPPILRKNVNNNAWKMRENDLDSSTPNLKGFGEEFHRRSLQHIDTTRNSDLNVFFNRNDDYRRTTQFSGHSSPKQLTRSSQSSLSSNNPFECEVNTDFNIPISNTKYRKKRRAPQPPSPLQSDIEKEINVSINDNGGLDIKSLANEIELFVNERYESPINSDAKREKQHLIDQNIEKPSLAPIASDIDVKLSATKNPVKDTTTNSQNSIENVICGKRELSNNKVIVPGFVGNTLTNCNKNQPNVTHPHGTLECTEDIVANALTTKDLDLPITKHLNKTINNENNFEENRISNTNTKLQIERYESLINSEAKREKQNIEKRSLAPIESDIEVKLGSTKNPVKETTTKSRNGIENVISEKRDLSNNKDIVAGFVGNTLITYNKNQPKVIHPHGTLQSTEDIEANALTIKDLDLSTTKHVNKTYNNENNFEENPISNTNTKLQIEIYESPINSDAKREKQNLINQNIEKRSLECTEDIVANALTTKDLDLPITKHLNKTINNENNFEENRISNTNTKLQIERYGSLINSEAKREKQNIEKRSLAPIESDIDVKLSATKNPVKDTTTKSRNGIENVIYEKRDLSNNKDIVAGFVGNTLTTYNKNQPKVIHPHGTWQYTEDIEANALTVKDLDLTTTKHVNKTYNNETNFEENPISNTNTKLHKHDQDHPISRGNIRKDQYDKPYTCKENQNFTVSEETSNLPNLMKKFALNESVSYSKNNVYDITPQTSTSTDHNSNQLSLQKSLNKAIESINRNQQLLNESAAKGTKLNLTYLSQCDEKKFVYANELNSPNVRCSEPESKNISNFTSNTDEILSKNENNIFYKTKILKTTGQYRESSPTSSNLDWNPLPKPKRTSH
ncbi:putative uncharacterized protein DDB_G0282133 isoform X1 [Drosophila miranda]|uniref:putative uncharacterized protein DDB_G0282133 isoform X1 n=1 Tax=Drosophila miranda TaxID=7229 RepID=UPI00143F8B8D|nr:putative uncharacterized protein DDB_G0282133 isoform X1 [Drosophila miranda]